LSTRLRGMATLLVAVGFLAGCSSAAPPAVETAPPAVEKATPTALDFTGKTLDGAIGTSGKAHHFKKTVKKTAQQRPGPKPHWLRSAGHSSTIDCGSKDFFKKIISFPSPFS